MFRRLHGLLKLSSAYARWFVDRSDKAPALATLARTAPKLDDLADEIDSVVDSRDRVADSASFELLRLRRKVQELDDQISTKLRRITRNPELRRMLQFTEPSFSGDRYVLAVKTEMKSRFNGLVHYVSDSGATSFMEPFSIVDDTNDLAATRSAEKAEERRLLAALAATVARRTDELELLFSVICRFDLVAGCCRYASQFNCGMPRISSDHIFALAGARHPLLLERFLNQGAGHPAASVVPLNITLGSDFNLLVITGPNTGGKTVALKTMGLVALMALCGLPVPADTATVPFFDGVYADIGDEQSIEQNLSTFSSHIERISRIIRNGTANSLVLLDELGSGTDPNEGAALGRAILEHFAQAGCITVVTTHIGDLKTLAYSDKRIQNAGMQFDMESLQPLFSLVVGTAGESRALQIALRIGLPSEVVTRARQFVNTDEPHSELWNDLQRLRREVEKDREDARKNRDDSRKAAEESRKLRDEWQQKVKGTQEALEAAPKLPQVGDMVYLRALRENGTIKRIQKKGVAVVLVKGREVSVPMADLEPPRV